MMIKNNTLFSTLILLAFLFLFTGCQTQPQPTTVADQPAPNEDLEDAPEILEEITQDIKKEQPPAPQPQNTVEFTMTARNWRFEPSTITVHQGDRVKITITSLDVAHGFALPVFNVNEKLTPGQTSTIEFVADKKGTYDFYCSVYCGAGHNDMAGQLIVQ